MIQELSASAPQNVRFDGSGGEGAEDNLQIRCSECAAREDRLLFAARAENQNTATDQGQSVHARRRTNLGYSHGRGQCDGYTDEKKTKGD